MKGKNLKLTFKDFEVFQTKQLEEFSVDKLIINAETVKINSFAKIYRLWYMTNEKHELFMVAKDKISVKTKSVLSVMSVTTPPTSMKRESS